MKIVWLRLLALLALLPAITPTGLTSATLQVSQELPGAQVLSLGWESVLLSAPTRVWRSPWYEVNRTLYAITDRTAYQTTDDGDTWSVLYHDGTQPESVTLSGLAVDPGAPLNPVLLATLQGPGAQGRVLRSTDNGLSWQTVLTDTEKPLSDVVAVRDAGGALVVFAAGETHLWRSSDGGTTWQALHAALPDIAYLYRVFPSPNFAVDRTVYLTGFNPPIRSTDGGLTWQEFSIPWVDIPREVVFSPNYAADGTLWVSYFWVEGSGEEDLPMNGIVRSTDRGQTWQKAREGLPVDWPDGWILGLTVSPEVAVDKALFAVERTASGEGTAYELYRSNNRGDSWALQGLAPNITPRGMIAVRRDLLFLATAEGLFRLRVPCAELVRNGNCELLAAWDFPVTPITADYSTEQAHSSVRSIRLGLTTATNKLGYSSARQRITLPSTLVTATLTAWLYPVSTGTQMARLSAEATTLPATMAGDAQYVLLLDDQGNILRQLLWTRSNSQHWDAYSFNLNDYIGRSFWLLFGTYNDGAGGKTGMYVDDVSLSGCRPPSAPPETPPPLQGNPIPQDFLLSDTAGAQRNPEIAYNLADDEYLVVWETEHGATTSEIMAQRLSSEGRLLGMATPLTISPTLKTLPDVVYLPAAERYLVVWQAQATPSDPPDIHGRLVNRAGVPDGAVFPIVVTEMGQVRPRVAAGSNAFLVVWGDAQPTPARIRGQRVEGGGALLGSAFDISNGAGWAAFPEVTYSPALGEFIVAWEDTRAGLHEDIYMQRVTMTSELSGNNVSVSNELDDQRMVALAANTVNHKVLFVWNDWRLGEPLLYGREMDFSGGVPQAPEFRISTASIEEGVPAVVALPDASGYLVVWQAPTGAGDLFVRRVSSGAGPAGTPVPVSDDPRAQTRPALAVSATPAPHGAVAVWQDARAGTNTAIYGQRLQPDGSVLGLHFGLAPLPRLQTVPVLAYSGESDHYLSVWANVFGGGGNQSTEVMAYLLNGDGALASAPITLTDHILTTTTEVAVDWAYGEDAFLATWSDNGTIVGQRVSGAGNLTGDNFVVSALASHQEAPVVVAGFNQYLVLFESTGPISQTTDIFGQLLALDGQRVGDAFNISRLSVAMQQAREPHAAYDAINNTFLVVWQEQDPTSPGIALWNIAGQMVAGEGGGLLGPRRMLAAVLEIQENHPQLAWVGPEDTPFYLLVWTSFNMSTGQSDTMARRLDQDGTPLDSAYPLVATQVEQESRPVVSYDPFSRRFLVVWDRTVQGMSFASAIQAQQLDARGRPEGPMLSLADNDESVRCCSAVVARRNHGEWLVAWEDGRTDTALEHINVYARRIKVAHQVYLPLILKQGEY
ncbi:MAG: BNR/Asp-box repeat protein [Chloroflexi bacterium ADurb.Bin360]|nr:MAG: BNR/Asp-box repeat protein [Chloroflexi bacterium ADurb.Bin360]